MARPMIAELLLHSKDKIYDPVRPAVRAAAHFRCDPEYVAAAYGFMKNVTDWQSLRRAVRLPARACFLEWPLGAFPSDDDGGEWQATKERLGIDGEYESVPVAELTMGMLLEQRGETTISNGFLCRQGSWLVVGAPIAALYDPNTGGFALEPSRCAVPERFLRMERPKKIMCGLAARATLQLAQTLLAFLQFAPKVVTVASGPQGRALVAGKDVRRLAHKTLMLNVPASVAIGQVARAGGWHVREHDVRGHWREIVVGAAECGHEYALLDDFRRQCIRCGRKVTWVKEHRRGHSDLGEINKDYRLASRATA